MLVKIRDNLILNTEQIVDIVNDPTNKWEVSLSNGRIWRLSDSELFQLMQPGVLQMAAVMAVTDDGFLKLLINRISDAFVKALAASEVKL